MPENALKSRIESEGFATVDDVLPAAKIDRLVDDIQSTSRHAILSRRNGGVFGGRDLLSESAEVRAVSQSEAVTALVKSALGPAALPVRAIYFDKNPDAKLGRRLAPGPNHCGSSKD